MNEFEILLILSLGIIHKIAYKYKIKSGKSLTKFTLNSLTCQFRNKYFQVENQYTKFIFKLLNNFRYMLVYLIENQSNKDILG